MTESVIIPARVCVGLASQQCGNELVGYAMIFLLLGGLVLLMMTVVMVND